jgi:hypothetical protein
MSTTAELEAAREKRAAARMALFAALAGSLIGGLAALGGAYLTYRVQVDTHAEDTKRAAYANFVAEAEELRDAVLAVRIAANASDQKAYEAAAREADEASVGVYPATAAIYILTERGSATSRAATNVNDLLLSMEATIRDTPEVKDFDVEVARQANARADGFLGDFLNAARFDLQGE